MKHFYIFVFLPLCCAISAMEPTNSDIQAAVQMAYQELESQDPVHRADALRFILQCTKTTIQTFVSRENSLVYLGMLTPYAILSKITYSPPLVLDTQKVFSKNTTLFPCIELYPGPKLIIGRMTTPKESEYVITILKFKKS